MIKQLTYKGEWYLPGEEQSYAGTLTFNPDNGAELTIVGRFSWGLTPTPIKVIFGKTSTGWVTLLDTQHNNGEYSHATQTGATVYKPSVIFVGHQFSSPETLVFRRVKFSLFNLLEWMEQETITEDRQSSKYMLNYSVPKPISFECYEGCNGQIEFSMDIGYPNEWYHIELQQRCDITLHYENKRYYKDILEDIFQFVRFLTLCTYEQSYPLYIELQDEDIIDEFVLERLSQRIPQPVQCIYRNAFYKSTYQRQKWHQHLVRYPSIEGNLSNILQKWFAQSKSLAQPIELLLRFFIDKYDFSRERFMDIIKALELFHRLHFPNMVLPKSEFKERKKKFLTPDITDEERQWLEQKLQHANEPTLKNRLEDIVRQHAFSYFNQRVNDKEKFCSQSADCRNYYTHFNTAIRNRALEHKELFDLTENLKLLLVAAILGSISIPVEAIEETVGRLIY